jgi:RHS repeat-associated protein
VRATYPDGTSVYTPFPDYEISDPPGTGANTIRTTYRLAGQMVALRVQDGTTNKLYYPLTDHLGNVAALSDADGNLVSGSVAHYDPFGSFAPTAPTTNPAITNHGFTGHRHNNTGSNDLGLIYMNARYYLPEVGRFISPDSLVPDPQNPQSFNRYVYAANNPVKYSDPTGHWFESFLDAAFIAYDVYDIQQNGLNWTNGLSLAADVGGLALPVVTGGGLAVRAAMHADDAVDTVRLAGHLGDAAQLALRSENALSAARRLNAAGSHSDEGIKAIKSLAELSTHGSGSRVVIGQWVEGAGYIAEAKTNGGIYYETAHGFWDAIGQSGDLAWAVNKQFLMNQLEAGVSRIDFVGESVDWVKKNAIGSFRWREIDFLENNAARYGYELVNNSWIKKN